MAPSSCHSCLRGRRPTRHAARMTTPTDIRLSNEERAARERLVHAIRALARCVNAGGIVQMVEEPQRGTYRASQPLEEQTRTVTFVVNARLYDTAFPAP
jgi:hypothetical protein